MYELDVYQGSLSGLVVLEVEVQSPDQLELIQIPPGFAVTKVTDDKRYSNWSLAIYGIPA